VQIGSHIPVTDGAISVPTATPTSLGVMSVGTGLTANAGAVSVDTAAVIRDIPHATVAAYGIVQIGSNIDVTDGTISVPTATSISEGVISLDSPAFTGVPVAPTPALSTNTDQIATTKFVQQTMAGALGNFAGALYLQQSYTLTTTLPGYIYIWSGSSSTGIDTITLPQLLNGPVKDGQTYALVHVGDGPVQLAVQDQYFYFSGTQLKQFYLYPGQVVSITASHKNQLAQGQNFWVVSGGSSHTTNKVINYPIIGGTEWSFNVWDITMDVINVTGTPASPFTLNLPAGGNWVVYQNTAVDSAALVLKSIDNPNSTYDMSGKSVVQVITLPSGLVVPWTS